MLTGVDYARSWVEANYPGWYVISIDEFKILWDNRFHINKALLEGRYTMLKLSTYYWTSSESLATNAAFYFGTGTGNIFTSAENNSDYHYVRSVKGF